MYAKERSHTCSFSIHVESRFLTSAAYLLKKTETGNVNVKRVKMDVKQAERRKRTNTRPCTRNIVGTMENGQNIKKSYELAQEVTDTTLLNVFYGGVWAGLNYFDVVRVSVCILSE